MFTEPLDVIPVPQNVDKKWEMRQDYITQKYTTSWDELPLVFVWFVLREFIEDKFTKCPPEEKTNYNIMSPNVYYSEGQPDNKPT